MFMRLVLVKMSLMQCLYNRKSSIIKEQSHKPISLYIYNIQMRHFFGGDFII